jgi:hypothetical protein
MIPEIAAIWFDFNGIGTQGYHRGADNKKSVNTDFSILLSRQKPV